MKKRYRVSSLFAGCGGMDLGITGGFTFNGKKYSRLQTEVVHASDIDKRVVQIYNLNFKAPAVQRDITKMGSSELPKSDIVLGGFPCQSFSVVAQNPKRLGYKDPKGQLFFELKRVLAETQPLAFIAENVKGLLSANHGQAFPLILQEFEQAGYRLKWQILNAADFGVPQKRERIFIVGFRGLKAFQNFAFPAATTSREPIPIKRFLEAEDEIDPSFFFSAKAVSGMKRTKNSKVMNKGRVQRLDRPSNTLGAHLAKVSLNSTDPVLKIAQRYRMFTPKEVARLQSFPESFRLAETKSHNYIALGNAVPPVVMWHVGRQLLKALKA